MAKRIILAGVLAGVALFIWQALSHMVRGRYVADVIAAIASIDIVLGEVDR